METRFECIYEGKEDLPGREECDASLHGNLGSVRALQRRLQREGHEEPLP